MAVSKVKPQILNYDFSFMTSQEEYAEKQTRWVERGGSRVANSFHAEDERKPHTSAPIESLNN